MSSLVRLDKVEGVKNEVHRGVLVALRDTDLSVKEIADSLGIASYSVYDIAHQYLPRGFMMARRKQLKRSSPDDLVHIVPPQSSNRPTVGRARAPENVSQDKSSSQSASKRAATGRDKDSVSSQAEPNRLTLEYGGFTFHVDGEPRQQFECLCTSLRACRTVWGVEP